MVMLLECFLLLLYWVYLETALGLMGMYTLVDSVTMLYMQAYGRLSLRLCLQCRKAVETARASAALANVTSYTWRSMLHLISGACVTMCYSVLLVL
jgi:hypothetical protein